MSATMAARPKAVVWKSACPVPWSRPGSMAVMVSTAATPMPAKPKPVTMREAMIGAGASKTVHDAMQAA
ncbi:MAG TPA: hypothetical protein VIF84_10585 [Candidatus Limnocylindrales bacterium]